MSEREWRGLGAPTAIPGPVPAPPMGHLGSYELVRPLAQGGMADIYLARRIGSAQPERHVAIKVLNGSRATDPEACAMLRDEARLIALLDHRNVAALVDADAVDGQHYIACEYVHGADLRAVLTQAERAGELLPLEAVVAIVSAAAAGLDHAHRRCGPDGQPLKLVHRDVSLSNIMVGHDGAVKVVDFGIATATVTSVVTLPGVVRGKASYMAPEQCLGDTVDHRCDVFALGVVLYELTTGARCFHGKTDFDRMISVVRGDYIAPSDLVASYPAELEQVVDTALSPSRERRFASAAAMIEALQRARARHGWSAGRAPIRALMHSLFGEAAAPWSLQLDDAPVTEPCAVIALPLAEPTRPARRLARGTELLGRDDVDDRTRGRRRLRRSGRSGRSLAA